MKQNMLIGLSMLIAMAFASCDKSELISPASPVDTRAPQNKSLVKEESSDDFTSILKYNNKGYILEEVYNGGAFKTTYAYLPGLIEMKELDSTGTLLTLHSMKVNPKGLVVEHTISGDPRTYYCQYDAKNRLIKGWAIFDDGTMGNTFFYFYNSAGDMAKDSLSKPDGYWNVHHNVFYTDIPNTLSNKNRGTPFLGEQSKHYMKRRTMTSSESELHVHDFLPPIQDADERIIERTVVTTNYNLNLSNTKTYFTSYY